MVKRVTDGLKDHFKNVHPTLFVRSMERARSDGELFDILDTIPQEYPLVWDNEAYKWITTDLLQACGFEKKASICFHN